MLMTDFYILKYNAREWGSVRVNDNELKGAVFRRTFFTVSKAETISLISEKINITDGMQ